jgi:hypothetical protein
MNLAKSCADHIRTSHASLFSTKLKAAHAHEIVAAAFGYKTAAALQSETEFQLSDVLKADSLILDASAIAARLEQLEELPDGHETPMELAIEIGNHLRFTHAAEGHIMPVALDQANTATRYDNFIAQTLNNEISVRSLTRLAPIPSDPQGLSGLPYSGQGFGMLGHALPEDNGIYVTPDAKGISVKVSFDVDAQRLEQNPWPEGTESPWFTLEARADRCGGRTGYALTSATLSNPRGEQLDLLKNAPALNITNPFDNPEPNQIAKLFRSEHEAIEAQNLLPAGTLLRLSDEYFAPSRLANGRPNQGPYAAQEEEKAMGLESGSLKASWYDYEPSKTFCPYFSQRKRSKKLRLPHAMSWSDAILLLNKVRMQNQPVGQTPRMFYTEIIGRTNPTASKSRPPSFMIMIGT